MASASIYGAFRVIGANSVQVTAIVGVANTVGAFVLLFAIVTFFAQRQESKAQRSYDTIQRYMDSEFKFAKRYIKGDFRHDRLTGMFVCSDGLASSKGQTVWIYNSQYREKIEYEIDNLVQNILDFDRSIGLLTVCDAVGPDILSRISKMTCCSYGNRSKRPSSKTIEHAIRSVTSSTTPTTISGRRSHISAASAP